MPSTSCLQCTIDGVESLTVEAILTFCRLHNHAVDAIGLAWAGLEIGAREISPSSLGVNYSKRNLE